MQARQERPLHALRSRTFEGAPSRPAPEIERRVEEVHGWLKPLTEEVGRVVVGQDHLVARLLVSLLTGGHALLEGLPGLAKTLAVKTLSQATHGSFKRVQFTPDMLPADIVGTLVYDPSDATFHTRRGPIFANFVLADEINRAPAKVQSALLEAMEERQVTIGDTSHPLPAPFLVLATQNPVDQEGTYALPEAQLDRFLLKLRVTYPERLEERLILDTMGDTTTRPTVKPVVDLADILAAREVVDAVYVDDRVRDYIVDIVAATRKPGDFGMDTGPWVRFGASPRGTLGLFRAARAWALLCGRSYVSPTDVKMVAHDVLRHRIGLTYEGVAEGLSTDDIVDACLHAVPTP
ncbi:MAG: MoxR family ATPase [Alphaproteobacteria bacterium]|nr:MoxR family ATPase [Alphaproteobacteria bacterium]